MTIPPLLCTFGIRHLHWRVERSVSFNNLERHEKGHLPFFMSRAQFRSSVRHYFEKILMLSFFHIEFPSSKSFRNKNLFSHIPINILPADGSPKMFILDVYLFIRHHLVTTWSNIWLRWVDQVVYSCSSN